MNRDVRLRPGLLRHRLDSQLLVYDTVEDRVHLLNSATGCLFEILEDGRNTQEEILSGFADRTDVFPDPALVGLAIEELRKAGLLDEKGRDIPALPDVTRRELLQKVILSGAAALVPAVITLTPSPGYAQASQCGTLGDACIEGRIACCPGLQCRIDILGPPASGVCIMNPGA